MKLRVAILIGLSVGAGAVLAEPVTAVGAFTRHTDEAIAREIILRFPIVLSRVYTRAQKGRVIYPNEFVQLSEKKGLSLKVRYTPDEYAALAKILNGGSLITGEIFDYTPQKAEDEDEDEANAPEEKLILVRLHHYNTETLKLVSLNVIAKPETVIAELVRHLLPLEKDRYLWRPIPAGSKIVLLAPLDAVSLNNVLAYLLELQFDMRVATGNDYDTFKPQEFEPLREIRSNIVSYTSSSALITHEPAVPPLSPALDNAAERQEYNEFAGLYSRKVTGFENLLSSMLIALGNKTKADYLLVLQPFGKNPFARGFDLQRGGLVWFQDSFPSKSSEPGEVIAAMVAEMQRPVKMLNEAQLEELVQGKDRVPSQGASGGLASVAILDFYDRTKSPLYAWLSNSLSTAIDESMKKIFEYNRADEIKSAEVGARIFKTPSDINPKNLKDFQTQTGADYLIFGFYSLNKQNGNIVIESKVYDLVKNKAIGGSTTESPVDVRLFNVVDEISQGIVQDIFTMTQTQNK